MAHKFVAFFTYDWLLNNVLAYDAPEISSHELLRGHFNWQFAVR